MPPRTACARSTAIGHSPCCATPLPLVTSAHEEGHDLDSLRQRDDFKKLLTELDVKPGSAGK